MGAYSAMETDEFTGGIVFAKSNIAARKIGANLWNHDELGGMQVSRRKDLDKYEATGVPAWLLVSQGWHFECHGCGVRIDDASFYDEGLPVTGVVGYESGSVYCCHACRMTDQAREAACEAFGAAFIEMLKDVVRNRFPDIEHAFGEHRQHVYVPRYYDPLVVVEVSVHFSFPGMKIGPASLRYRHASLINGPMIGPVRPEFFCCNGDREAFEEMVNSEAGAP